MKQQSRGFLLASFITAESEDADQQITEEVHRIVDTMDLSNKYIFLFEYEEDSSKKILTYNAIIKGNSSSLNPRLFTMRIHRKKLTNTLYTINALNKAVANDNNGETGKHLKLDWEKYRESILLTSKDELQVHKIKVAKIFQIEEPPAEE
mgnify:FL=1|tara:strand:+ start:6687 stop:7136 length:450 start_codon:yes stop_codon:yes gene_type:complete